MLISIETHITCDFPGGGGGGGWSDPDPPSGTAHESDVSPLRVLLFQVLKLFSVLASYKGL